MSNWMHDVPGDTNITKMAIPGTHDSGAYSAWVPPLTRAQDHSILEQLKVGVRALDIRCGKQAVTGYYKVYHGPIDQGVYIEDVFKEIKKFLKVNGDEFVILMLKQETGSDDISTAINDLVKDIFGDMVFGRSKIARPAEGWPDLVEVRGQVLVLSRLKTPAHDHFDTRAWERNPKKQEVENVGVNENCRLIIQDLFDKPALDDKKKAVEASLTDAQQTITNMDLFLNFTSYVKFTSDQPYTVGRATVNSWLKTDCPHGKGVICVDGVNKEIAKHIISMNNIVKVQPVVVTPETVVGQSCILCKTKCDKPTGANSRWHHCKQCHAYYCGPCASNELDWYSYFSRSRKCKYCVWQTELV